MSGGRAISAEQVELINAYGPYDHAVWTSHGLEISNEERLAGRGAFLVRRIRECILKHFTLDKIKTFSILDVGCYDGWILHQLSDLPFSRMVGVEPREKNIVKGQKVREILNIQSRVEFKIGDIDSLGDEIFDIVICTGVLHHIESTPTALHRLRSVCRRMLFIETICLSSKHITKAVIKEIEMKDVVYLYKDNICGLTGQKFESSYYDGSTAELCVVSIPSVESLRMYMNVYGFDDIEIVADPQSYRAAVWKNRRPFNAVCICGLAGSGKEKPVSDESSWVRDYEGGLVKTVLKREYIEFLYEVFCLRKKHLLGPLFCLNILLYIRSPNWLAGLFRSLTKIWLNDKYALEIVKNLRFNPEDKLRLEYGKILYHEQDYEGAISILKAVTQKVNADWRAVYRSFYLLSRAYEKIALAEDSERYKALCLTCNLNFPLESLQELQ